MFIDCETTSLRPDRRAWEVALVRRACGQPDAEHCWLVQASDLELGNADLGSLRIGRYFDRHPGWPPPGGQAPEDLGQWQQVAGEAEVLRQVETLTRGAVLVGAVPSFDAEVLAARMRANGMAPSWHYHLQDFETLIAGFLRGQGKPVPDLPWRSDELSGLIGVAPPAADQRHTALGDARWAVRVWDAVMGGA